jgi:hypothetical protein
MINHLQIILEWIYHSVVKFWAYLLFLTSIIVHDFGDCITRIHISHWHSPGKTVCLLELEVCILKAQTSSFPVIKYLAFSHKYLCLYHKVIDIISWCIEVFRMCMTHAEQTITCAIFLAHYLMIWWHLLILVAKIKSKTSQILIFKRNYSGFRLSLYDKNKDSLKL